MPMNEANMIALAATLRTDNVRKHWMLDVYFSDGKEGEGKPLSQRIERCGAVACGAGWAAILANPELEDPRNMHEIARAWLGLSNRHADELFTPDSSYVDYNEVTPDVFADVLDGLRENGEVRWPAEVTDSGEDWSADDDN